MALAARKLEEVRNRQPYIDDARRLTLERAEAIRDASPHLWNDLGDFIEDEVRQLSAGLPSASSLRVVRNENKLTVYTMGSPSVTLEIVRSGRYILASCSELRPLCPERMKPVGRYHFAVDDNLDPCFSDGVERLHPTQVADIMLKPVFDLF